MTELYAILPAYNEEDNIEAVILEWLPVIQRSGGRLVVVDDGSTDNTTRIVNMLREKTSSLDIIVKENGGHGSAVLAGYRFAIEQGAKWVFQTDSDGQTNPDEFAAFWKQRDAYDAIIGMRPDRGDGFVRKIVEAVLRWILGVMFRVRVPDANAPFRLMRAELLDEYLKKLPPDYAIPNVMITVFFVRYGRRVLFKNITFQPRTGGTNSMSLTRIFRIGVRSVRDFLRLRREL